MPNDRQTSSTSKTNEKQSRHAAHRPPSEAEPRTDSKTGETMRDDDPARESGTGQHNHDNDSKGG